MTKKIFSIVLISLVAISADLFSQHIYPVPPACPGEFAPIFKMPPLLPKPLYSTDMPLDVLVGYIAYDSLLKNISEQGKRDFLNRQSYTSDSLRQAMKYLYSIKDYDPTRWSRYENTRFDEPFTGYDDGYYFANFNSSLAYEIEKRVNEISPFHRLDYSLLTASIIAHIVVTDTVVVVDDDPVRRYNVIKVINSSVIDPIKGKVIPNCILPSNSNTLQSSNNVPTGSHPAVAGSCLQFSYYPASLLTKQGSCDFGTTFPASELDPSWNVYQGKEYIAFLWLDYVCVDSTNTYWQVVPVGATGCVRNKNIRPMTIFPVENGIVNESGATTGFGTGLTVAQFKAKLRERINWITHPEIQSNKKDDLKDKESLLKQSPKLSSRSSKQ